MLNLEKFRDARICRERAEACRVRAVDTQGPNGLSFWDLANAWERLAVQYERLERDNADPAPRATRAEGDRAT